MNKALPIIYSAHHASPNFHSWSKRCVLTTEQRLRFSDYGTSLTVPENGILTLRGKYSRGIIDLNRDIGHERLFPNTDYSKPKKNPIWKKGYDLQKEEKVEIIQKIYTPYHNKIMRAIRSFGRAGIVIAWDNTAYYPIGKNEQGKEQMMKSFILSNQGAEGFFDVSSEEKKKGELPTCNPQFLEEFVMYFKRSLSKRKLPTEIYLNHVFKGGHVAERYNTYRHPDKLNVSYGVQSFQIEYDMSITHDSQTLIPKYDVIVSLREAFEEAIENVLESE